ncbi:hypothetical protein RD792_009453 [Penstemon davidsonii]|uniref:Beta-carotene isomerase D27-like C-terminal domain-containing protein n=1 Tax=Penstemon davidsonii TaxID=160366 RepID=A0ABR0CZB9_9LAMI|nr:hypothetical protein RD792_009453 [Penstemon davidsonii]
MDAMIAQPYRSRFPAPPGINRRIAMHNPGRRSFIVSVLADKNTDTSSLSTNHDDDESKNVIYQDNCYDRLAINHLSQSLQAATGMCTNLCKMPSQMFIKEYLGMPINMVPNFDDMSCEMIFGQEPPPQDMDPAFTQPCYKQCNI